MALAPNDDSRRPPHPLGVVRHLVDLALDDLGGLVAATESADAEGLPRYAVRIVLLQALCGVRADVALVERLRADAACRDFVGFGADGTVPSVADCAQARRDVLGISGFDAYLRILLALLERRGALADPMFAPDRDLPSIAATRGASAAAME